MLRSLIVSGETGVVHDLSDGGLAVAAAEMALASEVGAALSAPESAAHAFLFGEDQARYLIAASDPEPILAAARAANLPAVVVGRAGGDAFAVEGPVRGSVFRRAAVLANSTIPFAFMG